ncbi:unnamed protein product, partial [Polarella glacialis]
HAMAMTVAPEAPGLGLLHSRHFGSFSTVVDSPSAYARTSPALAHGVESSSPQTPAATSLQHSAAEVIQRSARASMPPSVHVPPLPQS